MRRRDGHSSPSYPAVCSSSLSRNVILNIVGKKKKKLKIKKKKEKSNFHVQRRFYMPLAGSQHRNSMGNVPAGVSQRALLLVDVSIKPATVKIRGVRGEECFRTRDLVRGFLHRAEELDFHRRFWYCHRFQCIAIQGEIAFTPRGIFPALQASQRLSESWQDRSPRGKLRANWSSEISSPRLSSNTAIIMLRNSKPFFYRGRKEQLKGGKGEFNKKKKKGFLGFSLMKLS
ncbi:hypothetical protein PUN28_005860 [Cardiocondyla obscurior]|uniref:Uncharacterized protein n=1 Tax=Cardiocondyla obscurior TaxID=286306 RepID=A0AAW2G833_9HYME